MIKTRLSSRALLKEPNWKTSIQPRTGEFVSWGPACGVGHRDGNVLYDYDCS